MLDTSGSMLSGMGKTWVESIKNFISGPNQADFAMNEIANMVDRFPQHTFRIGTYATTSCMEAITLRELNKGTSRATMKRLMQEGGNFEQLIPALTQSPTWFTSGSKRKVLLFLGDLGMSCNSRPDQLCQVLRDIHAMHEIDVQFFYFTLPADAHEEHPCLAAIGTDLKAL